MTVSTSNKRIEYAGNGSTTVFAYNFRILDQSHIEVILVSSAGVETVQTLTTNYTVSGVGNSGGGNITMVTAPASGESLVLRRNMPFTQDTDYVSGDPFAAETHEDALDELTMNDQELLEITDRSLKVPKQDAAISDLPIVSAREDRLITFDASGNPEATSYTNTQLATAVAASTTTNPATVLQVERQLGSQASGQVFTFSTITYTVGANNLFVYQGGQKLARVTDYTETSSTSITINASRQINSGDNWEFLTNAVTSLTSGDTASFTHTEDSDTHNLAEYLPYLSNGVVPYGAAGDGSTDDTSALAAALAKGVCILERDKTYKITSRLLVSANNTGFICPDGFATILMDHASFNATTYAGFAANSVGFYAEGYDNITLKGIHIKLETGSGIRTACGAAFRNCTNIHVDVEASNFKEMQYGAITLDSCIGGECRVYAHDITANTNTLGSMQLTGLMIDENRISSVYSKDVHFIAPRFKNITLGATAIAAYGRQTDGMTFAGGATSGTGGCVVDTINAENVYEVLDIQSSNHNIAGIRAKNVDTALKLVHAGKDNIIGDIECVTTAGPVVAIAGTNTASESASNNIIGNVRATGVGDTTGTGLSPIAVIFSGGGASFEPNNNVIKSLTVTGSSNMTDMVLDEAGVGNKVLDVNGAGSTSIGRVDSGRLAADHVYMTKLPRSAVRATLSADQTGVTNGTVVAFNQSDFDTQSELNTGTGIYTAKAPMIGRVSGNLRLGSLGTGKYVQIRLVADGQEIAAEQHRNDSGGTVEANLSTSALFRLENQGKTVSMVVYTDETSIDISSAYTSMCIEEIG